MSFKVVDLLGISALVDYQEMFRKAGVDAQLVVRPCPMGAREDEIIAAVGDGDAVVTQATFQPFSRNVISGLVKCRLIASVGVGYDYLDVDAATEFGILATNVPDASVAEVSDHTMALILTCTRGIARLNEVVKSGGWTAMACSNIAGDIWPKLSRLEGQTLGIIGLGRIGRAVVPRARGFRLRVIAYDPYVATEVFESFGVERVKLNQLLTESDIISIHCVHTYETTRLIGLKEMKMMKQNACLINTARGAIVDHDALQVALTEGFFSMAAVDVTEPEPIPFDNQLLKMDNFIVTAHSAGMSPPAFTELQRRPGQEIIRILKGEWPVGLLNPEVKEEFNNRWGRGR